MQDFVHDDADTGAGHAHAAGPSVTMRASEFRHRARTMASTPPSPTVGTADSDFRDSASRAASAWPDSTRPEPRASAFAPSSLDWSAQPSPGKGVGSAFDVCHVGVVLRAVLLVQGVVALAVLHQASDATAWLAAFAQASIASLWGILLWLAASCLLKRWLSALDVTWQWLAAVVLGGLCAALGVMLLRSSGLVADLPDAGPVAALASGAAIAAALFYWLRLRALARMPADATARLAELQSRIRPHFLFNTLNTAVTLVRLDPERAEAVLEDLAELFRVALTESGGSVSLAEEVELARRYLAIEQVRFGERLQVHWEMDPAAGVARVPPLLLQPLIENAVRHGIEPSASGGTVRVRSRARRGHAVIDVVNTLGGTPSTPGHGIALRNVRERLRLMHDVASQFTARRDGNAFRVHIVVPLP
jgi:two-component system sensor histidine kinase AlgZ